MTTIVATRDTIASDTNGTHSNSLRFCMGSKLSLMPASEFHPVPFVIGFARSITDAISTITYMANPKTMQPLPNTEAEFLVLTKRGDLYTFTNPHCWVPIADPFYAIGSGSHLAMGALCAKPSLTLDRVIGIAGKYDPSTGTQSHVIRLREIK